MPELFWRLNKQALAAAAATDLQCAAMKQGLAFIVLLLCLGQASAETLTALAEGAISAYRRQHGLPAVKVDAKLMQLASQQAHAMARAGVLDHNIGGSFQSRLSGAGRSIAAENIAAGTHDFASTLDMWKRSSGHRANLLKGGVTRIGIASAPASQSKDKLFWTLILAGSVEPKVKPPRIGAPRSRRASIRRSGPPDVIRYCGEAIAGLPRIACE